MTLVQNEIYFIKLTFKPIHLLENIVSVAHLSDFDLLLLNSRTLISFSNFH